MFERCFSYNLDRPVDLSNFLECNVWLWPEWAKGFEELGIYFLLNSIDDARTKVEYDTENKMEFKNVWMFKKVKQTISKHDIACLVCQCVTNIRVCEMTSSGISVENFKFIRLSCFGCAFIYHSISSLGSLALQAGCLFATGGRMTLFIGSSFSA